jgi:xanthine dehydrogenase YagR molybdenum-binding subunit
VSAVSTRSVGAALDRAEAPDKVAGLAKYAYEYARAGEAAYAAVVQSTVAKGRVAAIDPARALAVDGVLAIVSHLNAPRLAEVAPEISVLQTDAVAYRGQIVAAVVATTLEAAREAAALVDVEYEEQAPDVDLRWDRDDLHKPASINPNLPPDTFDGDFDAAFAAAEVALDETYETPAFHANPIEPHATTAIWHGDGVTLYDSNQGTPPIVAAVAKAFSLDPGKVRVIAVHVGGAFGAKLKPWPHVLLSVMCSQLVQRPVKLAVTRQQMFAFTGYRTPTIQRLRLGATRDGHLTAIAHDVVEQTSTLTDFAEQTALPSRTMYAAPNRRTTHRLARLDVPTPSWLRAPGETPGMFALESAMDELALRCGLDPIELRIRNEPETDPESGHPYSTRNLVRCFREGADRFAWNDRDRRPGVRSDGRWLIGTGVAASTYPARTWPAAAAARAAPDGTFTIAINATDIGTGARTILRQIAADALDAPIERVAVEIGDSILPAAGVAGGSMGTATWGTAVVAACTELRSACADGVPPEGVAVDVDTTDLLRDRPPLAKHAFGAQFAEVRVDRDTGEIRVPRLLGVFAVGAIVNPKTARSQLIGGMTMGLSMTLFEESVIDRRYGDYLNHDLASYHVATIADVLDVEATWIQEHDTEVSPMGAKGIGEIGIVGTSAAIANAVHHATGRRIRRLPIRGSDFL